MPKRRAALFQKGFGQWIRGLIRTSFFVFLSATGAAGLLALLVFSSYLSIKSIEISRDNFSAASTDIENRLKSIKGKNIFFISKEKLRGLIRNDFPEFEKIEIRKIFPSTLQIHLASHPMVANLRAYYILPPPEEKLPGDFSELNKAIDELSAADPSLLNSGKPNPLEDKKTSEAAFSLEPDEKKSEEQKCLLNRIGQAIFDQQENLELMTLSLRGLKQPVQDREQVMTRGDVDYLFDSTQYFNNVIGKEIREASFLPFAKEIHLKTKDKWVVWLSADRDFKAQINKLKTALETAGLSQADIAYFDVRPKDKVIYCPRISPCGQREKE